MGFGDLNSTGSQRRACHIIGGDSLCGSVQHTAVASSMAAVIGVFSQAMSEKAMTDAVLQSIALIACLTAYLIWDNALRQKSDTFTSAGHPSHIVTGPGMASIQAAAGLFGIGAALCFAESMRRRRK